MQIVLCVTGSVAAVESVKLARELKRQGAGVRCFMSEDACKIIHPYAMEFATGNKVIMELTGEIEHVKYSDADVILVAPATANIIGKLAYRIADNPISSLLLTASGQGTPILMVPSMHQAMYNAIADNIRKLEEDGVVFVEPRKEEGKAKFPDIGDIVLEVFRQTSEGKLKNKRVLISLGGTYEPIDPIRGITNLSSGKMGLEIAKEAYIQGAEVTLITGRCSVEIPAVFKRFTATTASEMNKTVIELIKNNDIFISAAAVSDFKPIASEKKISSSSEFTLTLKPNPKIIDNVKKVKPEIFLVGFKAEHGVSEDELIRSARDQIRRTDADIVLANDVSVEGFGSDKNLAIMVSDEIHKLPLMEKSELAKIIVSEIKKRLD